MQFLEEIEHTEQKDINKLHNMNKKETNMAPGWCQISKSIII